MWDENSFDTNSYDSQSWLMGIIAATQLFIILGAGFITKAILGAGFITKAIRGSSRL